MKNKKQRGITLIALVITIIIMLILAGVVLKLTIGERGIFKTAGESAEKMEEAEAREKLELVLLDLQADKVIDVNYNEKEYINTKIQANEMIVNGNIVFVNGWQFQIDRSVPKIVANLGKGQPEEQIQIGMTSTTSSDYVKATIKVEIAYEKEIESILLNGENIEIPEKQEGKYVIEKEVTSNGTYSVIAKDAEDKYNIKSIKTSDITEDMDIYTVEDMVTFRDKVNSGRTFEGRTVRLMNDLDLSSLCGEGIGSWEPIGDYGTDTSHYFSGTFEGNNHTVSNIYINDNTIYRGLFGRMKNSTVKNLKLSGNVTSSQNAIGILTGSFEEGNIENVTTTEGSTVLGGEYAGGIVGMSNNTSFTRCINNANVTGTLRVGGVTGAQGWNDSGTDYIQECGNNGNITASSGYVGGITGWSRRKILYCYNTGAIKGNGNDGTGYTSAGGIAGASYRLISYCYNTGNVYGAKGQVGGISGNKYKALEGITYCYNIGTMSGSSKIGSIVGECSGSSVSYSYWTSTRACRGSSGSDSNCKKMTEEELKAYTNDKFKQDTNPEINSGFPILYWQ